MKVKAIYRALLPEAIRTSPVVSKLKAAVLGHDGIYSEDYYASTVEDAAGRSVGAMADSIVSDLNPKTAIDVGCGTGALLEALRSRGVTVCGLEYSKAGLRRCAVRNLDVSRFDIENDSYLRNGTFDVAISMEVAEHLPGRVAERYIDLLTRLSRDVVFTAAPVGQGGEDHVNEQPPEYWIEKYAKRGFRLNNEASTRWAANWKANGVESWYYSNLMVFSA